MTTYSERQKESGLRDEVVRVCRLMWEKGFVAASDGNVSVRLGKQHLLTTPSGVSKGFLSAADVVLIDMDGNPVGSAAHGTRRTVFGSALRTMSISAGLMASPVFGG